MKILNKALNWILLSSAKPAEASLAMKGFLVSMIPLVVTVSGLAHINIDGGILTQIVDSCVQLVNILLSAVGLVVFIVGLTRKFYLSLTAQNVQVP